MGDDKKKLVTVSFKTTEEVKKSLEERALAEGRYMTNIINDLIFAYLNEETAPDLIERLIIQTKEIQLLLINKNPKLEILKREVNNLQCMLKKTDRQS